MRLHIFHVNCAAFMVCDLRLQSILNSLTQLFQLKVLKSEIERQREVSLPMSEGLLRDSSETGKPGPMHNLPECC